MLLAFGALALAVLVGQSLLLAFVVVRHPQRPQEPPRTAPGDALELRVAQLELKVAQLPNIWEEETKRASRHRDRAQKAEARAREITGESEGERDPDQHVLPYDAGGGGANGLPSVSSNVGAPEPDYVTRARALGYPWSFLKGA